MREVDVDAKVLAQVDGLEPPPHALEAREAPADVLHLDAERQADARGAQRVVDVEFGGNVERHLGVAHRCLHAES